MVLSLFTLFQLDGTKYGIVDYIHIVGVYAFRHEHLAMQVLDFLDTFYLE